MRNDGDGVFVFVFDSGFLFDFVFQIVDCLSSSFFYSLAAVCAHNANM